MYHLVYISRATQPFGQDELLALLRISRDNNARSEVTGVLLYANDRFFQVLEGPEAAVKATAARIGRDPRHTTMDVLLDEPISERQYAQWSMGYVSTETLPADAQATFTRMLMASPHRSDDEASHTMLRLLLKTLRQGEA